MKKAHIIAAAVIAFIALALLIPVLQKGLSNSGSSPQAAGEKVQKVTLPPPVPIDKSFGEKEASELDSLWEE